MMTNDLFVFSRVFVVHQRFSGHYAEFFTCSVNFDGLCYLLCVPAKLTNTDLGVLSTSQRNYSRKFTDDGRT